ncbi:DUF2157 domain-containing protein [Pseudoalteromonas spongiae]|uniref:DUF2157 domain-containing protein n=1 Tax=Pseudoalteromonas spongiae TaxID=298657 RepID=A0ABU8EUY6_9GAMM
MDESQLNQADAQQRVDQIHAFESELAQLQHAGVITMPVEQQQAVSQYHQQLLTQLAKQFDVDTTAQSKHLTLGMKIASLFGALAMAVSLFFLFYQFWGYLSTIVQVGILVATPIALFCGAIKLAENESHGYFAKIAGLVAYAGFVLNVMLIGQIFNLTPSPNAFLIWAGLAFILSYAVNARVLLFFAIVNVCSFIAMKVGAWSGMYWISFGERPENFIVPSILLFLVPHFINQRAFSGFAAMYRVLSLIILFLVVLILSNWGGVSYFNYDDDLVEGVYQVAGFALSAAAIWLGIRKEWSGVVQTGNVFFVLFLYTKFFDWWWDWMPKYLFFFVLGLCALLALLVFKRIRKLAKHTRTSA